MVQGDQIALGRYGRHYSTPQAASQGLCCPPPGLPVKRPFASGMWSNPNASPGLPSPWMLPMPAGVMQEYPTSVFGCQGAEKNQP